MAARSLLGRTFLLYRDEKMMIWTKIIAVEILSHGWLLDIF